MNAAWKKLCPQFIHRFKDSEKYESYEDVANYVVKSAEQLELEDGAADAEKFPDAHLAELTDKN